MKKQIALIIISMLAVMPAGAQNNNTDTQCTNPDFGSFKCSRVQHDFCCNEYFYDYGTNCESFYGCPDFWQNPAFGTDIPQCPDIPDVPEKPVIPETPDTPDIPQTPIIPEVPEVPETPDVPDNDVTENETPDNKEIAKLLTLVNNERVKNGIMPLTYDETLELCAYVRSVEIKSLFSHTRPNGTRCFTVLDEYGYDYSTAGENIAYGQDSAEEVFEAWMNSEGHRENILSPSFTRIGMSCHDSGTLYWAQMFASK